MRNNRTTPSALDYLYFAKPKNDSTFPISISGKYRETNQNDDKIPKTKVQRSKIIVPRPDAWRRRDHVASASASSPTLQRSKIKLHNEIRIQSAVPRVLSSQLGIHNFKLHKSLSSNYIPSAWSRPTETQDLSVWSIFDIRTFTKNQATNYNILTLLQHECFS